MCFDPVSLGLAAAGTLASTAGGMMNSGAQAQQASQQQLDNARAAAASNAILAKFQDAQAVNQKTNDAAFAPTLALTDPTTFRADQQQIANTSSANTNSAISGLLSGGPAPALSGTDGGQSAKEIADRTAARTDVSRQTADHASTLNAFGTNFANLGLSQTGANRSIDATNGLARSQATLLPTDEQNAALGARQYVAPADYTMGSALQGLGNVFASVGGSGALTRALQKPSVGNPSLAQSTFAPSGATSGSSGGIGMA